MERKRLIFFTSADPSVDPGRAWSAYHFANVAAGAGLEAEVRLAGDAVKVALADGIAETTRGAELRQKVRDAVSEPFLISL